MSIKKMRAVIETITPERALELKAINTENYRPVKKHLVKKYARDMRNGRWFITGDTIKITNGVLADGQHRILAVIESGITIVVVVVYDAPGAAKGTDQGSIRTVGIKLRHDGFNNYNMVAAAAKLALQYDYGKWSVNGLKNEQFTSNEVIDLAHFYRHELEAACKCANKISKQLIPGSIAAALIFLGSDRSKKPWENETIRYFWDGFGLGTVMVEGEPCFALRKRMVANTTNPQKIGTYMQRLLTTIAWNKTVNGEQMKISRLRLTGPTAESPPNKVLTPREDSYNAEL